MYVACYDYNPSLTSPNLDTRDEELKLQKGDVVRVLGPLDHDGFFYAEVKGRCGFVPSNYLQHQSKPKTEAKMNKSDKK
ncbi:unnamed protein product [Oikopleura dioica]|uniref:SH3 domain-containing protein n=1 Tax=Oikopleura dioica TaxID=34765 RepID=E4Z7D3_OIKDI|nr:unnamed protein product [Oikopleura dioica]